MIRTTFYPEEGYLYIHFSGKIGIEDITDYYTELINKVNIYPKNLLILQDEREADFEDSKNLIHQTLPLLKKLSATYPSIKVAIWQTVPVKVAYSMVFIKDARFDNYQVELFYTREAALNWLRLIGSANK